MMTLDEQAAYMALPERVTIYRGCSARRLTGASWSLDPDVARGFPTLSGYCVSDPVLITARVHKDNILALKLDRQEQEVITFKIRRTRVEEIKG
jgi:hypothetical protein